MKCFEDSFPQSKYEKCLETSFPQPKYESPLHSEQLFHFCMYCIEFSWTFKVSLPFKVRENCKRVVERPNLWNDIG